MPITCTDVVLFACFAGSGFEGEGSTCSDGLDNDGDGFIDCAEPDCEFEPYCNGGGGCLQGPNPCA